MVVRRSENCVADFHCIEAVRVFDRELGQESRRVCLRRRVVAHYRWSMRAHAPNEFPRCRSDFGPELKLVLPLARADQTFGILAQIEAKFLDPCGDASEHRNIQRRLGHGAHHREVVLVAARADECVDAISAQCGK